MGDSASDSTRALSSTTFSSAGVLTPSSSSGVLQSSSGMSTSSDDKKNTYDPRAFGRWLSADERLRLRDEIQAIVLASKDTPLSESKKYIAAVSKLVSAANLAIMAQKRGWHIKAGTKKGEVVEKLLRADWALPSDQELHEIFMSSNPPAKTLSRKRKTTPGDDDGEYIPDSDDESGTTLRARAVLPGVPTFLGAPVHSGSDTGLLFNNQMVSTSGIAFQAPMTPLESGLNGVSLGQVLQALASESRLRATLLEDKINEREDKANFGAIPKAVKKALKEGSYTSLCHFWDRAIAEKRARALDSVPKRVHKDVKEFEWNDFIQAMLSLSMAYSDSGQANLGRQVINLLHGAMIISASSSRASVMEACEAVRQKSTSTFCQWGAHSLYQADYHVLLSPITRVKKKEKRDNMEKQVFVNDRFSNRPRVDSYTSSERHAKPYNSQRINFCKFWIKGEKCNFNPCKFRHECDSCGPVKLHDPSTCPIATIARKVQKRT